MTVHKCQITIFHSSATVLSKGYSLVKGVLTPRPNPGALQDGSYQVYGIPDLMRLNSLLTAMTTNHGLVVCSPTFNIDGGPALMAGRAMSRALAASQVGEHRAGIITRSGDSFPARQPGLYVLVVDFDRCPEGILCLGQLRDDLAARLPELDCAIHLRTSASCLLGVRGGGYLKGFKAHGFIIVNVQNDSEFKAIGRAIRLRLEPHDYVIDTSVQTPEHWIFAGPGDYGPGLKPMVSEPMIVPGVPTLDAGLLLASVPAEEVVVVRERVARETPYTEAELRTYRLSYLPHKLEVLRAWATCPAGGETGRHMALNSAVVMCGPYEAAGVVAYEVLWDIVLAGADTNGYLAEVGMERLRTEFDKSLDDGARMNVLPPLTGGASLTAGQAFGGVATAPCLPGAEVVADAGVEAVEYMAQWLGQWTDGNHVWPVWELFETPEGQKEFEASALSKGDKKDVRRAYTKWQKGLARQKFADAVDNIMEEMNEKYAFINDRGGKSFVMWVREDDTVVFKSVKDFKDMESNHLIVVDGETKDYGSAWLKHARRRVYDGVIFDPNNETGSNYYNLWRGLAIEPIVGDWHLQEWHIRNILASGDNDHAEFILNCFAWKLQNPGRPLEVSLAFRGKPGTGKGVTLRGVKNIFGKHGLHATNPKHLTGDFNAHLETCCFLFADEAYANGDKKIEGIMKGLITEPTLIIEPKGVNPYEAANRLAVMQATNNEWVAPVGIADRRYAIFDVSDAKMGDWAYFDALYAEMANGGLNAFLAAMLARDVSTWKARSHLPDTAAKREQAELSLSPIDAWWLGILETGELPGSSAVGRTKFPALYDDLYKASSKKTAPRVLGNMLRKLGGEKDRTSSERSWTFQPLADCRTIWDATHGARKWEDDGVWMSTISSAKPPTSVTGGSVVPLTRHK